MREVGLTIALCGTLTAIFTLGLFIGTNIGAKNTVRKFEEICTSQIPLVKRMEGYSLEMSCTVVK